MNSSAKKSNSSLFEKALDYLIKKVFIAEEIFTILFMACFIGFFYFYGQSLDDDQKSYFSSNTLKLGMWLSGILALVSHLQPKTSSKSKQDSLQDEKQKNLYLINNRLRESLMTAIKLDEQKRLEYIRNKPHVISQKQEDKRTQEWQPIQRRNTIERYREESFNLI